MKRLIASLAPLSFLLLAGSASAQHENQAVDSYYRGWGPQAGGR